MRAEERAEPLSQPLPEWFRGAGEAAEGKPGLLQAMEAAWHKAAKRGAQAAGRRVKWALVLLSAFLLPVLTAAG